jgi:tRNA pseudouridine13 synthase
VQQQGNDLTVSFALPAGCFATSVLRELLKYQDCGRKTVDME